MSIIREILDLFRSPNPNAPYYEGHKDYWHAREISYQFSGGSLFPLMVKYLMRVSIRRVNNEEFNRAMMLDSGNVLMLLCQFRDSFLQWMSKTNRHFHIGEWDGSGCVLQITPDGIKKDDRGNTTTIYKFMGEPNFVRMGCEVQLLELKVSFGDNENNIWGNYNMVARKNTITPDEALAAYKAEELAVLVYMKTRLSLLHALKADQEYREKAIVIRTQIISETSARIGWTFTPDGAERGLRLQVFRKEGGYALTEDASSQGALIIDSRSNGSQVERVSGHPYFYSCFISSESGRKDFFRFELSVPPTATDGQLVKVLTDMIATREGDQAPAPDPKRERLNRAFEELSEFVEFDESLTRWERDLITQIGSKNYSDEERAEKIERLKLAVEDLRLRHS